MGATARLRARCGGFVGVAIVVSGLWLGTGAATAAETAAVGQSETLWAVATRLKPKGATIAQTAWALYQANPEAFEGSPGAIKHGVTLQVPDLATIRKTPAAEAYALVTGKPASTAAAVAPAPVPRSAAPAPAPRSAATRANPPQIAGVELMPLMGNEKTQGFAVVGSGFQPGAVIEFRNLAKQQAMPARKPSSATATRLEYGARFGRAVSRWEVVVRNPDGRRSVPFAFEAGADVTIVLAAQPPAVAAAAPSAPAAPAPPASMVSVAFLGSADHGTARDMVQTGRAPAEVYEYLAALEDRYAGDVEYDYALGTNAHDAGRYSEAVLVLQRAVASRPKYAGARMELARAYYALGDNESARREFTALQGEDPPEEARRVIADYLDAIDRRAVVYQAQQGVWAELVSGYDSNANGAPDTQNFLGFTLDSRNQSTSSGYYALGLGGGMSWPLAPGWRLQGNGQGNYRGNPDASFVDSQVARLSGGVEWRPGKVTVSVLPGYTYAMLDGEENHTNVGVDGSAAYAFDDALVSVNARVGQQRYVDALTVQDVDQTVFGFATQTAIGAYPRFQLIAALTGGTEEAVETGSPFGRDLSGARGAVVADFGRGHSLLLSLASLASDFDGRFFGRTRSDDQISGALGYQWGALRAAGWTVRAQLGYVDNRSTVELYDYERVDFGVGVRREFK